MNTSALATEQIAPKHAVLRDVFGYSDFREGQEAVVDALISGQSVLAVMPTGAGKSLCFQVPALVRGGLAIVVSPLVALMQDQVSALKLAGVEAEAIHSGQDREANIQVWRRVQRGEISILYMAPERLMTSRMIEALSALPVSLFAIDEAHCMSQWGPAFRPEYAALETLPETFPEVPVAAMTATADRATRQDIEKRLFRGNHQTFISGFDRPNITLSVTQKSGWKNQLLDYVEQRRGQSGIVYCLSRSKTEEAEKLLRENGIEALAYHAGLDKQHRAERHDRFVTEDGIVMTATIAFGMGIDKPDVRFVFHTDLPGSVESYYQEIGRAGRDGNPADAYMLFGAGDIRMRHQFIEREDTDPDHQRREVSRLNALVSYAEALNCRRQSLLTYFGEESEPCGNCDNCLNPQSAKDGEEEANMVISAIIETGEIYGQSHIIDVVRGAETEKITKARHDRLECHGIGQSTSRPEWQGIVRQMISAGLLEIDVAGYSSLRITEKGNAFTRGQGMFFYRPTEKQRTTSALRKAVARTVTASPDLSERDHELLAALKRKRLDLAQERGVPAYVIFPDRTLEEMAAERPSDQEEMLEIKGVGKSKMTSFGQQFLAVIAGNGI